MDDVQEAIKRLRDLVESWAHSHLTGAPVAITDFTIQSISSVLAKLGLAEQRITELEAEKVDGVLPNLLIDLQGRITELEALTDPCPHGEDGGSDFEMGACSVCGGLGRVAKAQPETRRVQIDSSPLPDGYTMAHVMDESRCVLAEWIDDEEQDGELWLTMLAGSGSWESEQ